MHGLVVHRVGFATGIARCAIDRTANRQAFTAVALDYRGEKLRLTADATYQEKELHGGLGAIRIGGSVPVPPAPRAANNYKQPWEVYASDNRSLQLGMEYDLTPDWVFSASHGQSLNNETYLQAVSSISNVNGNLSGSVFWIPGRSTASGIYLIAASLLAAALLTLCYIGVRPRGV